MVPERFLPSLPIGLFSDHPSKVYSLSIPPIRMTRATRFASYASAVTLCYFLVWLSILPIPLIAEETKDQIIPVVRTPQRITTNSFDCLLWYWLQLPWWVLVSFGSYSLASLGWGLWTFRDCPDAYTELMHVRLRGFLLLRRVLPGG